MEVDVVVRIFEAGDAVAGKFELWLPEASYFSGFVFVVTGGGDAGDGAVEPAAGIEPVAPFEIGFGDIDEVTSVEHKVGVGGIFLGLADDATPHGFNIVLSVTEIDEGEGFGLVAGGFEVEPFAVGYSVADAVAVFGVGSKGAEGGGVIVGGIAFG